MPCLSSYSPAPHFTFDLPGIHEEGFFSWNEELKQILETRKVTMGWDRESIFVSVKTQFTIPSAHNTPAIFTSILLCNVVISWGLQPGSPYLVAPRKSVFLWCPLCDPLIF